MIRRLEEGIMRNFRGQDARVRERDMISLVPEGAAVPISLSLYFT